MFSTYDETWLDTCRQKGLTGNGIRIGHLDTGVDITHPALRGKVAAFCYFDEDGTAVTTPSPFDTGEHGTQTASLICKVAPEARLYTGAVIEGGKEILRILAGMEWLLQHDIRILCMLLGVPGYNPVFASAVAQFRNRGILPIAPVGNGGIGKSRSPGNYPGVLSVGAVNKEGDVPAFSGSQHFRRADDVQKPNLVAPGYQIKVAQKGGTTSLANGTSMAAAYVAGVAALLFQAKPDASVAEVEDALMASSTLPDPDFVHRYGRGIVNPLAALEKLLT